MNYYHPFSFSKPWGLARFVRMRPEEFLLALEQPSYDHFTLKKRNGKSRSISAPKDLTAQAQHLLAPIFQRRYTTMSSPIAHGFFSRDRLFSKYRDIVSNAIPHIGKNEVWNIDLQDFFPSITASMVKKALMEYAWFEEENTAHAVTLLCCYQGKLPQGAPTSPSLSNLVCLAMDDELHSYCQLNNVEVTRYADDITFSTEGYLTPTFRENIKAIIRKHGFTINPDKERLQRKSERQLVTGLKVNERLNIDRRYIRHLRAVLHHWQKSGIHAASDKYCTRLKTPPSDKTRYLLSSIGSRIAFVGKVRGKDDPIFQKLHQQYQFLKQFRIGEWDYFNN